MLVILLTMMQCVFHCYEVVFSLYNMKYDPKWCYDALLYSATKIIMILESFVLPVNHHLLQDSIFLYKLLHIYISKSKMHLCFSLEL